MAIAEADPERREKACRLAPGVRALGEYPDVLDLPEIDGVVICLPNALHVKAAVDAFQRGKHVHLEKPLALTLEEAASALRAWRGSGAVGMIGFNLRFNKLFQAARKHIESGNLGHLVGTQGVFSTAPESLARWKRARETGGGVLLDVASHHVDLLRFLFQSEVREVFAQVWSKSTEADSAALQLRLSNGLLAQAFFTLSSVEDDRFTIYGSTRKLSIDRHRSLNVEIVESRPGRLQAYGEGLGALLGSPYLFSRLIAPTREGSYNAALAHFVSAIQSGGEASPDLRDGYLSLAVIEAAERSAISGKIVSVPETPDENLARQ